jgi:exodeoxyribonuclease V alpha subunit
MEEKKIRLLDSQFAKFLAANSALRGDEKRNFQDLICQLSMSIVAGDSCYPLSAEEEDLVLRSTLCGEGAQPLCVFSGHLYLQRLFQYEKRLAAQIVQLASEPKVLKADASFLESLFVGQHPQDLQRIAAEKALQENFLIISGGPGTGKTTTVVKILALLKNASGKDLRIALAAPTGKAAMRLQEAIAGSVQSLPLGDKEKENFPVQASTLHRLLGVKLHSPFFRHNAKHPLPFDVLVVDEASMVDLALMGKLVDALGPKSRLILLGDKNQLASVESGTVLADMMDALPANTIELQKSYRFDKAIKRFADFINTGNASAAWQMLEDKDPEHMSLLHEDVAAYGGGVYSQYMELASKAKSRAEYRSLFPILHSFKILCAMKRGRNGVAGINEKVEQALTDKGYDCMQSEWYHGRPVMVVKNEYSLDLYNGDIGICLMDPEFPGNVKVWFERPGGGLQGILPGRLKSCETVYAMTIHKSQGTEVEEVLVVLPENESNLITRELLYTAVTRASKKVKIKSSHSVFQLAVAGRVKRYSGLVELLRGVSSNQKRPPL